MDKLPFVGVFTEAYQSVQTIWQRFRTDFISLVILGTCLYFSGYRLEESMLSLFSLQDLKAKISLLNLLDTDVARDIGIVTILGIGLAIAAIVIQGAMVIIGSS
ncbi:MAG TPA: hypothetical protein VG742_03410, partial [Dongiaceae bacterium]|nr:hypothetical protein [Dongiaceae bacterium]